MWQERDAGHSAHNWITPQNSLICVTSSTVSSWYFVIDLIKRLGVSSFCEQGVGGDETGHNICYCFLSSLGTLQKHKHTQWNVCGINEVWQCFSVHEAYCSGFWRFVITHCNTSVWTFPDCFLRTRMRPRGWRVSFLNFPAILQITLSSVRLCLLLSEVDGFRALCSETVRQSLMYFSFRKLFLFY